jgi:FdhE protein
LKNPGPEILVVDGLCTHPREAKSVGPAFSQRAERAETLARGSPAASVPLDFAARLYRAQGTVAVSIESAHRASPLSGCLHLDLPAFAPQLDLLLALAARHGPPDLARTALAWRQTDCEPQLAAFWDGDRSGHGHYLARVLLRPYGEVLAAVGVQPEPGSVSSPPAAGCRLCAGAAWIAWRRPRAAADGDGVQRFLGCALCGGEWTVNRIGCPACGEDNPDNLPCFQSDRHPATRLEACATCHTYVKSIDLGIDARAIPEVDDLLSLSMDLWAAEEGYTRLEPGLAGV